MPTLSLSHYYRTKRLMQEKRDNFLRLVLSSLNVPVPSGTSPRHGADGTKMPSPCSVGQGKNETLELTNPA